MKKYLLILIMIAAAPLAARAQVAIAGASELGLTINPASPGPNTTTTIAVSSFAFNPNTSNFTWTLNGKKSLTGTGKQTFSFKTGDLGSQTVVGVSALNDGLLYQKTVTFYQNDADLLWEVVDGYAPGFYEGKIFPTAGDTVQVTALPSVFSGGKPVAASKLNYAWSENFKTLPDQSGLGKNTLTFIADRSANSFIVDLGVTNPNNPSATISRSVVIPSPNLQALIYLNQPLVGPFYGQALTGTIPTKSNTLNLKAEVFNVSKTNLPSLSFNWALDGQNVPTDPSTPSAAVITQNPNASSTNSFLSLKVASLDNIFETTQTFLTILFGNSVQF